MPVGIRVRAAAELKDPLLHAFRDHVLEALGFFVDLVPAVATDLDQEHLEQTVVAAELERCGPARTGQLLATVAIVIDETLSREPGDHLADRGGRDAHAGAPPIGSALSS